MNAQCYVEIIALFTSGVIVSKRILGRRRRHNREGKTKGVWEGRNDLWEEGLGKWEHCVKRQKGEGEGRSNPGREPTVLSSLSCGLIYGESLEIGQEDAPLLLFLPSDGQMMGGPNCPRKTFPKCHRSPKLGGIEL